MATVSTSASTSSRVAGALVLLTAGLALAAPALAGPRLDQLHGHIAFGYASLFATDAPGGSLAAGAGIDYPLAADWRLGVDVGFNLLGSVIVERGSLGAELDYSLFESLLLVHYRPPAGPLRFSAGPGFFHARADLSSSGAAGFSDLAIGETAPGFGVALTLLPRRDSPLKAGFELGARQAFLEDDTWTVGVARLTIHY